MVVENEGRRRCHRDGINLIGRLRNLTVLIQQRKTMEQVDQFLDYMDGDDAPERR